MCTSSAEFRSIRIVASSVMDKPSGLLVLMFWDFYLPPIDECMVICGCSRGEESGSLYLADPIAIMRCEERKFSHRP
jgi:hypothetical protein